MDIGAEHTWLVISVTLDLWRHVAASIIGVTAARVEPHVGYIEDELGDLGHPTYRALLEAKLERIFVIEEETLTIMTLLVVSASD